MQSTDHLDETNLTKKNWEMITNLTAENEKYDQIKASINQFVEDPAIDSYGIRSLKRQLEDYLVIIDAIKNANDKDIRGYHSVNFILGDEYLDGNVVILREQEIEMKRSSDAGANAYWALYHSCVDPLDACSYKDRAEEYEEESRRHAANILEYTRIILKYDGIELATRLFLKSGVQYRQYINEALETMGKAFDGTNYNPNLSEYWRGSLAYKNPSKSLNKLKREGVTDEQIENMKDKGYSYEDILNFINLCETETDREFLDDLMNKDYEAAFQINPYDLSDNMFVIVTDYSVHMLHFDSNNRYDFRGENPVDLNNLTDFDELEAFSNAILASTNQPLDLNGNTISLTYRDIYLENITGCAGRMTQIQAGAVALMNPGDVCFDEQMAEYYRTRAAFNLWSAENALCIQFNKDAAGELVREVSISNLNFGIREDGTVLSGIIRFDIHHQSVYTGYEIKTDRVMVDSLTTTELQTEKRLETLENARVAYEDSGRRMVVNTLKGVSLTALAASQPQLAAVLSFVDILANNGGQLYGADSYVGAMGSEVAGDVLSGILQISVAHDSLDETAQAVFFETFGDGACLRVENGSETLTVGDGFMLSYNIYDPGTIHMLAEWRENGMGSWVEFGTNSVTGEQYTVDDVKNYINALDNTEQEVKDLCIELLDGPDDIMGTISGGDGQIDGTDMEKLMEAMNIIKQQGDATDLYKQFQTHVEEYNNAGAGGS
uniref:Uncharacterized protein n=1 Tax=Eubacterium cellulosolvens (strain ATCC 43171 / JCM 9499 / 6) TaxID=633697 RepID=I5AQ34_EUBC6